MGERRAGFMNLDRDDKIYISFLIVWTVVTGWAMYHGKATFNRNFDGSHVYYRPQD